MLHCASLGAKCPALIQERERQDMEKLTQARLDRAIRHRDRTMGERLPYERQLLRDHEVRGFYVAVHAESIAYWFNYRPHGKDPDGRRPSSRFVRIGDGGTHALAEAREAARELRRRVQKGEDPKTDDAQARELARAGRDAALAQARTRLTCEQRLSAYQSALQGRGHTEKHRKLELARTRHSLTAGGLAGLLPEEINHAQIEQALATVPPKSRLVHFGALDRFLRWSLKGTDRLPATAGFDRHEKPKAPPSRQRVLRPDELAQLWHAAGGLPSPLATDVTQFLIAVPARRSEARAMRWTDVDLAARVWTQPTSKNGFAHAFPLNRLALEILHRRKAAGGDAPFPFTRFDPLVSRLRELLPELPNWRLHDLRRSFASTLADAGFSESVLDLVLNHAASRTRGGVLGVYQRAERWDERVRALDAWADSLERALGENVTPLLRRTA
jgi:integrase